MEKYTNQKMGFIRYCENMQEIEELLLIKEVDKTYAKFKEYCKELGKFKRFEVEHFDELTSEEVNEIIKHILRSNSATKVRDALIIRLTYDTGARIGAETEIMQFLVIL